MATKKKARPASKTAAKRPAVKKAAVKRAARRVTRPSPRSSVSTDGAAGPAAARRLLSPGFVPPALSHPKIQGLAQWAAQVIEIVTEKVVANLEDPKRYPLPADQNSAERRLRALLVQLPDRKRRKLAREIMPRVEAKPADRRQRLDDLAGIDLRSAQPVLNQAKALPLPAKLQFTQAEAIDVNGRVREFLDLLSPLQPDTPAPPEFRTLVARVLKVKCLKTTRELTRDEIQIRGFTVDSRLNVRDFAPIDLGKFGKNDGKEFPGPDHLQVASFDLLQGGDFPQEFAVNYFVGEVDPNRPALAYVVLYGGLALAAAAALVVSLAFPPATLLVADAILLAIFSPAAVGVGALAFDLATGDFHGQQRTVAQLLEAPTRARSDVPADLDPDTPRTILFEFRGGKYELTTNFALVS